MGKSLVFKMYKLCAGVDSGFETCASVPLEPVFKKLQTEFNERVRALRNFTLKFWVEQVAAGKGSYMGKIAIFTKKMGKSLL